ncbi:hypothetical protein CLU79DRAFT_830604 [Phycomyces nitens]|nr:hypothetical protein CLU79DRAFT_830604 [Phycomyces nitens]
MTKPLVAAQASSCYFGSNINSTREKTLKAILGTILAPLTPEEKASLQKNLSEIPSVNCTQKDIDVISDLSLSTPGVYESFLNFMSVKVLPEDLDGVFGLLDALGTPEGTKSLAGKEAKFEDLSHDERTDICLSWKFSRDPQLVGIFKTFSTAILSAAYNMSDTPHQAAMGYPGMDPIRSAPGYVPCIVRERYNFMTEEELRNPALKFDAIVIGSGAGGGVCAGELSEAGLSVLVIEKGKYYHESEFSSDVPTAYKNLYLQGGSFLSRKGELSILAGSTFGGATTVNFLASLKPQHFVREEWARMGLSHFTSSKFSEDLDKVYKRIGAETSGIKHNVPNQLFVDGCKKLGCHIEDIPQNTGGRSHECGWCLTGCKDGIKNGTSNSWLRVAAANNARFVDQATVSRVIITDGKATGVEFKINGSDQPISVNASRIVVSAGSLHSPGILSRSGLKNKNIGKNLRLHPVAVVYGLFEDRQVNPFEGSLMTAVSNGLENLDGEHYGTKLEVPHHTTDMYIFGIPWQGGKEHKERMLRFRQSSSIIALVRDKDSVGSVEYSKDGKVIVNYKLSDQDRKSIVKAEERAAMILVAAGAREIHAAYFSMKPFIFEKDEPTEVNNPRFLQWIEDLNKDGMLDNSLNYFSAHQMGTCRMGASPNTSVTQQTGETWETNNLYVCDASLFPTASGVNPMVTTETIAVHVSRSIVNSTKLA